MCHRKNGNWDPCEGNSLESSSLNEDQELWPDGWEVQIEPPEGGEDLFGLLDLSHGNGWVSH